MLSDDFKNILATAGTCASKLGHDEITLTHLMFVLCESGSMKHVFIELQMDEDAYKDDLLERMVNSDLFLPSTTGHLRMTATVASCIDDAESFALKEGRDEFTSDEFFVQILSKNYGDPADDYARKAFRKMKGMPEDEVGEVAASPQQNSHSSFLPLAALGEESASDFLGSFLQHGEAVNTVAIPGEHGSSREASPNTGPVDKSALAWCIDLVALAEAGDLDVVYGRDTEIKRICEILGRRKKNNPILIGEAGVGKTAAVEGLAVLIATGRAPVFLSRSRILALDVGRLVSGTRNRGDLEERVTTVLDVMKKDPRIILFIDEIHSLVAQTNGMAGVADLMKPALASGAIRCIGATTFAEFSKYFANDPALVRRFQEVAVAEPSREQTIDIMASIAETYASHHQVRYTEEALVHAVDLSIRYLVNRHLPDKAIDILDEAGSLMRGAPDPVVTVGTIVEVVRKMTRDKFIENGDPVFWDGIADEFVSRVAQHSDACCEIVTFLKRISAHPVQRVGAKASFLLQGQSGIGKAFIAETLASLLEVPFLKIDMGAYSERNSASGLIGAPPGYVGFDEGGKLTEFVKRQPVCVILFDKFDGGHSNVREIIEAALGEGTIPDARGRNVSFRNVIGIIAKDDELRAEPIGFFGSRNEVNTGMDSRLRFDRVFNLEPIGKVAARQLVQTRIAHVIDAYAAAGSVLTVSDEVVDEIICASTERGGKANDMDRAYSELFEAELFRHHVIGGATVNFKIDDRGRIAAILEKADEQSAA